MSGGIFNHLEHRLGTLEEYERVLAELRKLDGDWTSAVMDLKALIAAIGVVDRLRLKLEPVIHAVEWTASGDWGDDQLCDALDKYEVEG